MSWFWNVSARKPATDRPRRPAVRGAVLTALGLLVVLFVTVNLLAHELLRGTRIDLTENRLYSLSDATRTVLASIDEPITLRLFYSTRLGESLPSYGAYAARVRELLEQYAELADGGVVLEIYDPEPFTDEADRALAYGLFAVPVDVQREAVYFGLVGTNTIDDEAVVPFFQIEREPGLEHDLTRLVYALATPNPPVVGVLSGLPIGGGPVAPGLGPPGTMMPPWVMYSRLGDLFETRLLSTDVTRVDDVVDVLMVVHPRELSPAALYAIDQWAMAGRPVAMFVDPVSEAEARRRSEQEMFEPDNSDLGPFAESWGIRLAEDRVAGDLDAGVLVADQTRVLSDAIDYVAWLELRPGNLVQDDRITAPLSQVNMATAGILRPMEGATTDVVPLIATGMMSMAIDAARVRTSPNPRRLLADFSPGGERLVLAARVNGPASSAFPDGPPLEEQAASEDGAEDLEQDAADAPSPAAEADAMSPADGHRTSSDGPINVVVVADTDLLDDRFWVRVQDFAGERLAVPFADNGDLVANILESLAGAVDLSPLRGRSVANRPFERVIALQSEADARYRTTELSLLDELERAQAELLEVQQGDADATGTTVLSDEQRRTLDDLRARVIEVRRELRDVRRALREEVEALETTIMFANIGLVPMLVLLVGLAVAAGNMVRRRRRAGSG